MNSSKTGTIPSRFRQRLLRWYVDSEIFGRIMPHVTGERQYNYVFNTQEQMDRRTAELDVSRLLDQVETCIEQMPSMYGSSFRQIMHRDLCRRLTMFARLAQRRIPPGLRDHQLWGGCA